MEYHRLAIVRWKTCENGVSSGQMTYHVGRGAATTSQLRSPIEDRKQLLLPLLNHLRWIYEDQSMYYRRSFDFLFTRGDLHRKKRCSCCNTSLPVCLTTLISMSRIVKWYCSCCRPIKTTARSEREVSIGAERFMFNSFPAPELVCSTSVPRWSLARPSCF